MGYSTGTAFLPGVHRAGISAGSASALIGRAAVGTRRFAALLVHLDVVKESFNLMTTLGPRTLNLD